MPWAEGTSSTRGWAGGANCEARVDVEVGLDLAEVYHDRDSGSAHAGGGFTAHRTRTITGLE
eukprot:6493103-Prymnesium_polylepis.2